MTSFVTNLLSKSANTMVGQDELTSELTHGVYTTTIKVDRKGISAGIQLVGIAADEFESGNEAVALDIYLSGLDKIIMSLPSKFLKLTDRILFFKLVLDLRDLKTRQVLQEKFLR